MNDIADESASRREFLSKTGILLTSVTLIILQCIWHRQSQERKREEKKGEEVSPPEDLMREHGVLRRILLIYEDIQGRLNGGKAISS